MTARLWAQKLIHRLAGNHLADFCTDLLTPDAIFRDVLILGDRSSTRKTKETNKNKLGEHSQRELPLRRLEGASLVSCSDTYDNGQARINLEFETCFGQGFCPSEPPRRRSRR